MTTIKYGDYQVLIMAGSGGCGQVYVAKNVNEIINKKAYILKALRGNFLKVKNIIHLQIEIDALVKLNENPRCRYIPFLYDYDKYNFLVKNTDKNFEKNNIIINEENKKEIIKKSRPYYVIDYYSKGNLCYYIKHADGFKEKYARVIFKKILEAIKFCHNRKICHLDIKSDNVMIDKDFEPIIIDFGLSEIFKDENDHIILFTKQKGTEMYAPPEMWERQECNGAKCDIFSLGVLLFNLVTNKFPFVKNSKNSDVYYKKIHEATNGNYKEYWEMMESQVKVNPSDKFKQLFTQMVAYYNRLDNIDAILNSDWMNEFNNLSEQEQTNLEQEVKNKFEEIYQIIAETNKEIKLADHIQGLGYNTRSGNDGQEYSDKTPKKIPNDRININHHIIIDGALTANKFMSGLIEDIKNEFGVANISIRVFEEYEHLKFELGFYDNEENDNDVEETEEEEEENSYKKCVIVIELFQYENGKYLLEFLRTKGEILDYYNHFLEIRKIIEEKTLKFNI